MKKITALMFAFMLLAVSCSTQVSQPPKLTPVVDKGLVEESSRSDANEAKVYEDFCKLLEGSAKPYEIAQYMEVHIAELGKNYADKMVLEFEKAQQYYEDYYTNLLYAEKIQKEIEKIGNKAYTDVAVEIKDEEIRKVVREINDGGYRFIMPEGFCYPIINYGYYNKFSNFVSDSVKEYFSLLAVESTQPFAADGALIIPRGELEKRVLSLENYLNKYQQSPLSIRIGTNYKNYLAALLSGLDNTPAYDYQTKVYKKDVLDSLNKISKQNEYPKTSAKISDFLKSLQQDGNKYGKNAEAFIKELYNSEQSTNIHTNQGDQGKFAEKGLKKLLPEKEGFKWVYNGFVEYGHSMKVEKIDDTAKGLLYIIKGKVADMSDGEGNFKAEHFNIDLSYKISNGTLTQTKKEKAMMDSEYDTIDLIKYPLIKGNKWHQVQVDKKGEERGIWAEITDIKGTDGNRQYTVVYRDDSSGYYENRVITEGYGTVSFNKQWTDQSGLKHEIGYSLYKEASGY